MQAPEAAFPEPENRRAQECHMAWLDTSARGEGNARLLQPDSLPDAFSTDVPDASGGWGAALLAQRDVSAVGWVIHAHDQRVVAAVAIIQRIRDVHIELVVAAPDSGIHVQIALIHALASHHSAGGMPVLEQCS